MWEHVSIDSCLRLRVVYDLLLASRNEQILDVGCAWGYFLGFLSKNRNCKHTVGTDILLKDLRIAKEEVPESNFILASAINLPFKKNSFDKVLAAEVIEHLPEKTEKKSLEEIHYVLKCNGILVLSTPNNIGFLNYLDLQYPKHRHYDAEFLVSILQNLGFSIKELHLRGSILQLITFWIKLITGYVFRLSNRPIPKIISEILGRLIERYAYNDDSKKHPRSTIFIKSQKIICNQD